MMGFPRLSFRKLWTHVADFPTFESNETQVRADMQYHPDALKDFVNELASLLEDKTAAGNIGAVSVDGTGSFVNVQDALVWLRNAIDDITFGSVPPGSISYEKIAQEAVDTQHLVDESVTRDKLSRYIVPSDIGAAASDHTHTPASIGAAASDHTHTPASIGAATSGHTHTPASIGAAASSHTHTPASIGAAASSHTHTPASIGAASASVVTTVTLKGGSSNWPSKTQTVSNITGVTANNHVIVTPAAASYVTYSENMVRCTAQGNGSLTFQCEDVPSSALTVNILIVG